MKYLQYYTADYVDPDGVDRRGLIKASNSVRVPDDTLPPGVAQLEADDDLNPTLWAVDLTSGSLVALPEANE